MREQDLLTTARALALDRMAAEVIGALGEAGVEPLLLKGPVLARWLYEDGAARPYDDIDLLVAPRDLRRAYAVVERLGFVGLARGRDVLDLADTLNGAGLHPAEAWRLLRERSVPMTLAAVEVLTLDPSARALHAALHAWWHWPGAAKPVADLERALVVATPAQWSEAAELAARLHAVEGFAGGLALTAGGRALLAELGLPAPAAERGIALADADPAVRRLDQLSRAVGWRARAHVARRAAAPLPGELRAHYPEARGGPRRLAGVYAVRALHGARLLPRRFVRNRRKTRPSGVI